jgi:hypothetical protein
VSHAGCPAGLFEPCEKRAADTGALHFRCDGQQEQVCTMVSLSLMDLFTRAGVQRQFRPCSTSSRDIDAMARASNI